MNLFLVWLCGSVKFTWFLVWFETHGIWVEVPATWAPHVSFYPLLPVAQPELSNRVAAPALPALGPHTAMLGPHAACAPSFVSLTQMPAAPIPPRQQGHRCRSTALLLYAREAANAAPPSPRGRRCCFSAQLPRLPPLLQAPSRGHLKWVTPVSPIWRDAGNSHLGKIFPPWDSPNPVLYEPNTPKKCVQPALTHSNPATKHMYFLNVILIYRRVKYTQL